MDFESLISKRLRLHTDTRNTTKSRQDVTFQRVVYVPCEASYILAILLYWYTWEQRQEQKGATSRVLAIMLIDRHCHETFFVRFTCRILVLCRNRERLSQRQLKKVLVALLQKKKDMVSKIKKSRNVQIYSVHHARSRLCRAYSTLWSFYQCVDISVSSKTWVEPSMISSGNLFTFWVFISLFVKKWKCQ